MLKMKKLNALGLISIMSSFSILSTNTAFAQNNNINNTIPSINYQTPSEAVNADVPLTGVNNSRTLVLGEQTNQGVNVAPNGVIIPAPMSLPQNYSGSNSSSLNTDLLNNREAALIELMKADPDDIRRVLREIERRKRATKETTQSKAVQSSVNVYTSPGSSVPVIRTFANRTSSIVVVDQAGNPWPIENFSLGAALDFNVRRLDKSAGDKGYMLDITPNENYVSGNLVLKLEGLNSPLTLEIISGQSEYDAPLLFKVMSPGPNTQFTNVSLPEKEDSNLTTILQGVAPSGMTQLNVDSGLAQAWLASDGKTMYVRSKLKIMPFEHMTASPDGTYAYRVRKMPVLTYTYEDKYGQIVINGM